MGTRIRRILRAVFVIGLFAWLIFSSVFRNSVHFDIADSVNPHHVVITWSSENGEEIILLRERRSINEVGKTGGENIFRIYYRDKMATISQFKTKWWYTYKYEFNLDTNENGDVHVEFVAKGRDAVRVRKVLIP